ncbi:hypothetical protein [Bradyrhizobium sp. Tv2a-2]|uniref:hypothetical protein n=1 Tax=Bradyrhizobium sp. Tv2a-2 TaxID=113395 RepID=UPI0012EB86F3|nr:hypothetical protein [Bradyrhizobium sp. Tv2a-2]
MSGKGSDGGVLATTHEAGLRRPDVRAAVRSGSPHSQEDLKKKPAADCSVRAVRIHLDDGNVRLICPTRQTLIKMRENQFVRLKPILQTSPWKKQKPAAVPAARAL